MKKSLTALGEVICRYFKSWHETFIFWGEVVYSLGLLFKNPRKLRWKNFSYYFDSCGASALGIVLLICFLLGGLIGLGTVICSLGLGPFVSFFTKHVSMKALGVTESATL